jgi:hypothetical protein
MKLRQRQVEGATGALAKAVGEREAAEREKRAAQGSLERTEAAAQRVRDAERAALDHGGLRASDLQRGETWELGVAQERERLASDVAERERAEADARRSEEGAQSALAMREADVKVVEKHNESFDERHRREVLAKEEEAAADAHRPKRSR